MRTKLLFLLLTPLLISCQEAQESTPVEEEKMPLDYSDFEDLHLEWKNLFSPAKSLYFVYIYSISCGHCSQIKDDVLTFINNQKDLFYLMEYSKEIPTSNNVAHVEYQWLPQSGLKHQKASEQVRNGAQCRAHRERR